MSETINQMGASSLNEIPTEKQKSETISNNSGSLESAIEKTEPTKKPELDFGARFAALSRKEKEMQQQTAKIKAQMAELEAKYKPWQEFDERLSKNPKDYGIVDDILEKRMSGKYEDFLEYKIGGMEAEPKPETLEDKFAKLQAKIEAQEQEKISQKEQEEKNKIAELEAQDNAFLTQFKSNIVELVKSKPEEYELINHFKSYDSVYELIERALVEHDRELSVDEACNFIEKEHESQVEQAAQLKKVQNRLKPKVQEEQPQQPTPQLAKPVPEKVSTSKTLTNSMQAQVTTKSASLENDVEASKRRIAKRMAEAMGSKI